MPTVAVGLVATVVVLSGCGEDLDVDRRSIAAATVEDKTGFSPESVTVGQDHKVVLAVNNNTDKIHGFSIEGLGVRRTVEPNRPILVNFSPKEAGTFRIFCQLHDTHQGAELIVR